MDSHVITSVDQNPSYVLAYATDTGKLATIVKTVDGAAWTRTLTWTGANLTAVSVWVKA